MARSIVVPNVASATAACSHTYTHARTRQGRQILGAEPTEPLIRRFGGAPDCSLSAMAALVLVLMLHAMSLALVSSVPGGIYDITMSRTSEEVQSAMQGINDMFVGLGDSAPRTVAEVVRARQQIVAGRKLYLELRVTGGAQDEMCNVTFVLQPWVSPAPIFTQTPTCSPIQRSRNRSPVRGGISRPRSLQQNSNRGVQGALHFAVCASDSNAYTQLGDLTGATYTRQVTAGITFRFSNVTIVTTSCSKTNDPTCSRPPQTSLCAPRGQKLCNFVIQWRAWQEPVYSATSIEC